MDDESAELKIKEGLASGREDALDLLWESYAGELFSYAQSLLRSKQDAEDALHGLFAKAVKRRLSLAKAAKLRPYLFGMLRNEAMDIIAGREREIPSSESLELLAGPAEEGREPERGKEEIEKALGELPEEQRSVVVLKIFEGMKFKEIAEALAIPLDTAASRFRYALKKLKDSLEV